MKELIVTKNFTNNDFDFKNIFFDINSTIRKIYYYINNNFTLEPQLKKFYDEFKFNENETINDLINYLIKLK